MDRPSPTAEEARDRIARELRASEERLRAIFNSEPECLKVVDREGCVQEMNSAGLAMLEADSLEQVRGVCVVEFVHPDDAAAARVLIAQAANGERGVLTFRLQTLKGRERWAEAHATPLRTGDDSVSAILIVTHDITERRRAREERDVYAQAMRAMNVGLLIIEIERTEPHPVFRVVAANEAALRIARLRDEELIGWSLTDRFPALAASDMPRRALEILRAGKAVLLGELPYGDDRIPASVFNVAFTPLSPRSMAIMYQDVTEQRRLADQLQQWQKLEAIGRLAGGVAHDFNNLLTVIIGYVHGGLMRPEVTGELREELEQAHAAAERAARLTRQLLAFSRRQVLQPRVVDVDAQLREIEPMIARLREDVAVALELESGSIRVDPTQLEQVVMNLAMNACDAMPAGGRLTIRSERSPQGPQEMGPAVRIVVSDTGEGMDDETRSQIFEPFFTTKGERGTGLGLSTVYGIVKQSGGVITCESRKGEGTRFEVWLPLVADAPARLQQPPPISAGGRETVLVVEDQTALRRLIAVSLERAGYRVDTAANGDEALALIRAGRRFDLMVTDLVMPGMNGRQVADEVSRLQPGTRVVFISGFFDDATVTDSLAYFLPKPFTPAALTTMVRNALDAPRRES